MSFRCQCHPDSRSFGPIHLPWNASAHAEHDASLPLSICMEDLSNRRPPFIRTVDLLLEGAVQTPPLLRLGISRHPGHIGLEVIAEGVSSDAHLEALRALGCTYGQGYLFSPAVDASAVRVMLETDRRW